MPRSATITPRVFVACAALLFACAHAQPTPPTITSAELRAEIDAHNCTAWDPEARTWALRLLDERCPAPATTPLAHAVAAAVAEARGVRFLVSVEDLYYDTLDATPAPTHASADALARASFWRDPALASAVLDRAQHQLHAHQIRCDDCTAPPAPAPRAIPWATFFPYLAAFVWPIQPAADAPIEVYACSGINGAAALPPDPPLLHAGRLAAYDLALDESVEAQVVQLARAANSLADAHSQLATLLNSPELRAHACASLAATRWFTAITVADCPPAS